MSQTDHLGRETGSGSGDAQSVTGFAAEQGTVDASDPAVQDTLRDEERRRKVHTEHAERMSEQMAPAQDDPEDAEE